MRAARVAMFAGLCVGASGGHAQTVLDLDTSATAGVTTGSGTWDLGQTVLWTADGGVTRQAWNSASDLARIQHNYSSGSPTLTLDNRQGQVGTAGLVVTGNSADWTVVKLAGDTLRVGTGGIARQIPNATIGLQLDGGIELAGSQTWTNITPSRIYNGGLFLINGPVSGTGNLTLDGAHCANPGLVGGNDLRVGFRMTNDNAFAGSLTIAHGAFAWLAYGASGGNRIGDTSTLALRGGSVRLRGGSGTETVGATTVQAGANHVGAGDAGVQTKLAMGAISQELGGTLQIASTALATTTTLNTDGILGGWATVGTSGGSWAVGSANGTPSLGSADGTWRSSPSAWTAGDNVDARGGGALDEDVAINALRLYNQSPATPINLNGHVVTIASGGLLGAHSTGNQLVGGSLRSGRASGELFVHTAYTTTVSSAIVDHGAVPTILVKGGATVAPLILSGANTYTGATYLNSGALVVTDSATLRGEVVQAGGTTLEVRSGGRLVPGGATAATMTLNGNLTLGDGAGLELALGVARDQVTLVNPTATFTGASTAGGVTIHLQDGGGIARRAYPLIAWSASTTRNGVELSDFALVCPPGVDGELRFGTDALEVNITTLPPTATVLVVR